MYDEQKERVVLNVGGRRYETSIPTLKREADSLLAKMTKPISPLQPYVTDGLPTYFLDRDPSIFSFLLDYLRNGPKVVKLWFHTQDPTVRSRIYIEAEHFKMKELINEIENCWKEFLF
ncbi:hypothetical protein FSP39_003706 [Pinctada imbricata]|uniref:BTB domain-containing protein n=1 Tax=Pinctada imbricata TaxID=66713 RepID=A0AA88XMB9_PINIB|nr:hypothetical protein FSP39_003706 [Pinctada imbricata]